MDYLKPQLLILIPVLIGIGRLLTQQYGVKPKLIPYFLLVIAFIVATVYGLITSTYTGWRLVLDAVVLSGICHGAVAAFTAMGLYDTAKSTVKKE
jgi:hypothetical protein